MHGLILGLNSGYRQNPMTQSNLFPCVDCGRRPPLQPPLLPAGHACNSYGQPTRAFAGGLHERFRSLAALSQCPSGKAAASPWSFAHKRSVRTAPLPAAPFPHVFAPLKSRLFIHSAWTVCRPDQPKRLLAAFLTADFVLVLPLQALAIFSRNLSSQRAQVTSWV